MSKKKRKTENPSSADNVVEGSDATSEAAREFFRSSGSGSDDSTIRVSGAQKSQPAWRSFSLLILVIAVSVWLMWSMQSDLQYFLSDPNPVNLGDIEEYHPDAAAHNIYVSIEGLPHHLQAQYKQMGRRYKVYPLLGVRVFVRERLGEQTVATDEYPSFSGTGRLLDIRKDNQYQNIRSFYAEKSRYDFSRPAWIMLADETPRSAWWIPVAYILLTGIIILNLVLLGRKLLLKR